MAAVIYWLQNIQPGVSAEVKIRLGDALAAQDMPDQEFTDEELVGLGL